jgi:hypothetical protein
MKKRSECARLSKPTLAESWKGLPVGLASAAVAIGILYVAGCGLMAGIKRRRRALAGLYAGRGPQL